MKSLSRIQIRGASWLTITLVVALLYPGQVAVSKEVPLTEAKTIGLNFIKQKADVINYCDSLVLVEGFYDNNDLNGSINIANNIYVLAIYPSPGFIIVSTDDRVKPILAYSFNSDISADNISPDMQDWMQSYSDQIEIVVAQDLAAPPETFSSWESLRNDTPDRTLKTGIVVSPLVQTTWNQGTYYNESCPYDEAEQKYTYTGCVATCMAQIMKYWNSPAVGQGSHSYTHSTYGELSADFGATSYNWSGMPSSVNSSNEAVATLMYHCGVSVNMNYSPAGSGAYNSSVLSAMPNYFKYSSDISLVSRSSYNNSQWDDLLLEELVEGRPIYYTGRSSTSGHAFICDGYDGSYYHFNWGWGGYADGYFSIDNLNPATRTYNDSQQIIYNIKPDGNTEQPVLSLQPSLRSVDATASSVTFSVSNTGTGTMDWTTSILQGNSWINISSGASGTNSGTISVAVDANEGASRTATIQVTSSGATGSPMEVTIVQEAAPGNPDLYVNISKVNTPSLFAGDFFRADIVKGNQGTEASVPGLVKYVLSRNNTISQDDIILEQNRPDSWEAGYVQSYEFNDLRIPESTDPGSWYFIISLDSDQEVEEDDETNNIAVGQFVVSEPNKPDVYVTSLSVNPEAVEPMGSIEGHFTLGNAGLADMPASHYRYAISNDASYSDDDYIVSYEALAAMDAESENADGSTGDIQLPERIGEGDWYLVVFLDSDTEVEEENENNNTAAAEFTVVNQDLPDVYVNNLTTAPQVLEPMAFLEGHFVLGNSGAADMPASHFHYAISSDASYSGDDYTISYGALAAMDAGTENTNGSTGDFQLPESIGLGDWYLIVMLDSDSEFEEESESNNTAAVKFTVAKPDLYVSFGTVNTPSPSPGDYFSIDIEKGNQGGVASVPGFVKYILSRDNTISGDDEVLEEGSPTESWASGYTQTYELNDLRIPENAGQGQWYFIVSLDANNSINELNENNNIAVAQLTVVNQAKPDAYVSNLRISADAVQPMASIEGLFEIGNAGEVEMPASQFRYAISNDATYSGDDYIVSSGELSSMGVGFQNTNSSTGDFQLPSNIGLGEWYLIIMIDCDTEIDEENEGNNQAAVRFTVAMPDLYITFGTVYTPSIAPGDLFRLDIEKGNQGGLASIPGLVKYVLSSDNVVSGDDIILEEGRPTDSWAAGFNQGYEFNDLRIPESVEEGVWYFIVWLDAESEIDEISEGNNVAVAQFTVVSDDMPDVYVTNLSTTPNVVQPLSFIEGFFEIGNSGKAEMPSSHYRYAISKDSYYSGDDYTISYNELTGMNAGYVNNQASTGDFQLPENIGVGDWYLLVMLDCDAEIDEDNEGNNMAIAEFSVASPDLYVNFQTVYTNSVMPGDLFRADIEYGNQGQLASLPGKIKYFLSRDEIVSSEDLVLMESNPQLAWAAGYYQQYELNDLWMPETTEGGIWFIIASVDNDEEINELIEDNNIAYVQVVVSPTQPVLVLSESRMALAYQAGTTSFQISNSGTGNLTWSLSVVEGSEWLQIENDETSGSGEKTIVLNYDINSGCDSRNAILQIQSNAINSSVTSISITQESDPTHVVDLAIYNFTAELNCPQVSVNVLINNIGGCLSQGTKVEYFLCSSASCTNPLSFLGSSDCDPILNGESLTIQECIVLDGIEDGTYFLAAKIDPNDEVFENNEENNVSFYEISINSTGIEKNLLEKALTVYPNPTSDWVTVSLDGSISPNGRLTVIDQVGRVVDQFVIDELLSWEIIIDTRKWDAGIYSLLLNAGDELVYRKLVVR